MIQYIKYATIDPAGLALVKLADITTVESTVELEVCKLVHAHGDMLVQGTIDHHIEILAGLIGAEYNAVPVVEE